MAGLGILFWVSLVSAKTYLTDSNRLALKGYDPVVYFEENRTSPGSEYYQYEWSGAKWYFTSAGNKQKFLASPEKYAPQYGGYCAYDMRQGTKTETDPEAWVIADDKLYLFHNSTVKAEWDKNREDNIKSANEKWLAMTKEGKT